MGTRCSAATSGRLEQFANRLSIVLDQAPWTAITLTNNASRFTDRGTYSAKFSAEPGKAVIFRARAIAEDEKQSIYAANMIHGQSMAPKKRLSQPAGFAAAFDSGLRGVMGTLRWPLACGRGG